MKPRPSNAIIDAFYSHDGCNVVEPFASQSCETKTRSKNALRRKLVFLLYNICNIQPLILSTSISIHGSTSNIPVRSSHSPRLQNVFHRASQHVHLTFVPPDDCNPLRMYVVDQVISWNHLVRGQQIIGPCL